jgi:hypothetical protein
MSMSSCVMNMSARAAASASAPASRPALALLLAAGLLTGCGSVGNPVLRLDTANRLAASAGLQPRSVAGPLPLSAYLRQRDPAQAVTIYIEGDGLAWLNRGTPSRDPTPVNPVGLRLAAVDPSANVGWLARPCQYAGRSAPACDSDALWTGARFSETAVIAVSRGLDALVLPGQKIHLVGFSGGGAIAALVAARRSDVLSLRTVAGNLDHVVLNAHHRVSPMTASLNAADSAAQLGSLPQRHFVGGGDEIVPRLAADSFLHRQMGVPAGCRRLEMLPSASHTEGWAEAWPRLLRTPLC